MAKTWEELTDSEKIEDLRNDIVRIFRLLREFQDAVASDQYALKSQIEKTNPWGPFLNELQRRVERTEQALNLAEK